MGIITGSKIPAPGQTISGAPMACSVNVNNSASWAQFVTSVFLKRTFAGLVDLVRVSAS
jgi:hypothetical protein